MKQVLVLSIFILCVARLTLAAVSRLPQQPKPDKFAHKQGCYIPDLDRVIPYNKPYSPKDGSCTEYNCGTDGETQIFSCGAIYAGPGCKVVPGNKKLPYADCCSTLKCS